MIDILTPEEELLLRQDLGTLGVTQLLEIKVLEQAMDLTPVHNLTIKLARGNTLDRSPKKNWVENVGGLPAYIEEIAKSLHQKRGMTISRAIATAISMCKKWAAGGKNVNADTRAKAARAIAQWNAKRARAHRS